MQRTGEWMTFLPEECAVESRLIWPHIPFDEVPFLVIDLYNAAQKRQRAAESIVNVHLHSEFSPEGRVVDYRALEILEFGRALDAYWTASTKI